MSPGYDRPDHQDVRRKISFDCMFCHNGYPKLPPGTVEAWGRAADNPVGGWYGLKKGLRGRFGVYLPPLMETLGLCELTHEAKGNKMRAK